MFLVFMHVLIICVAPCGLWAWELCRISPPRFLVDCRMRRLNQGSFVLYFALFAFYRAMHFSAKRGIAIACRLSVRLSVWLSVTLVNCDHIG